MTVDPMLIIAEQNAEISRLKVEIDELRGALIEACDAMFMTYRMRTRLVEFRRRAESLREPFTTYGVPNE